MQDGELEFTITSASETSKKTQKVLNGIKIGFGASNVVVLAVMLEALVLMCY